MTGNHPPPPRPDLVLATRGSPLALWQAEFVTGLLARHGATGAKLVLKTTADRIQDRFLHELGGKGLFIKELEDALAAGRADLAVHSLKDMPAVVPAPFALAAVLARHAPTDVLIYRPDVAARLAPKAVLSAADAAALGKLTVATGSLRRQAILRRVAPELTCVGVRGNVDTRLRKLAEGQWDALILAEASLDRLGIKDVRRSRLAPDWFIPCASQGALGIESRLDDPLRGWLETTLGDPETTLCVEVERAVLARLGGDCMLPFGCLVARSPEDPGRLVARAGVYDREGGAALCEHAAPYKDAASFPRGAFLNELCAKLKDAGAGRMLARLGMEVPAEFR